MELNLVSTIDKYKIYKDREFIIISKTIDYDSNQNYFNTIRVEVVITKVLSISS